jgi:hypothetical protein
MRYFSKITLESFYVIIDFPQKFVKIKIRIPGRRSFDSGFNLGIGICNL